MAGIFKNKWSALFLSNFLGVYNDNLLKNCIVFTGITWLLPSWLSQSQLISIVSAGLVLPYLFLSPYGGTLAVKYSKLKVFRFFKFLEIPIMLIASVAFYYQFILLAVFSVFLMGIQSCLYSPSKYSLIRDIGGESEVSFGSGIFEMMAFSGILIGTITASVLSDYGSNELTILFFLALAFFGYYTTCSIKVTEQPEIESEKLIFNPIRFLTEAYKFAKQHINLNTAILGASLFWLIGGMLQMNLIIHSKNIYHLSNSKTGMILAFTAIGIALGCWSAGKISGKNIKPNLIIFGLSGMTLGLLILTFMHISVNIYVIVVVLVAYSGGFFQVPCLSMVQKSNIGRKLGEMIAYLNLVTFILILAGTILFSLITNFFNENSYVVFGAIFAICAGTLLYFNYKFQVSKKLFKTIRNKL